MKEDKIICKYKTSIGDYTKLKKRCDALIDELCQNNGIQIHTISSRIKKEKSLKEKIANKGEKYKELNDITDILGIRIITLFEDDVIKVEKVLKDNFKIDSDNSEDKFDKLKSNEFGYRSVHFVCSLNDVRKILPENKNIGELKFEIQVRSILQHAWAEIERDLGYKFESDLPDQIQRDFFRVAGLLELADMEFIRIKKEIMKYASKLRINDPTVTIPINVISFDKFLDESFILNYIDAKISKINRIPIKGKFRGSQMMKILKLLEIKDLTQLEKILKDRRKELIDFTTKWIEGQRLLRKGLSIWTLAYIMKAQEGKEELENYLESMNIGGTRYLATNSERIFKTIELIKST